jgi:hypothetical protein
MEASIFQDGVPGLTTVSGIFLFMLVQSSVIDKQIFSFLGVNLNVNLSYSLCNRQSILSVQAYQKHNN